jgi:taurine dioxygenase
MRFRRLQNDLGAEVLEFDPTSPASHEVDDLRCALDEHELLLFRGGHRLEPEVQVEITSWFGSPTDDSGNGTPWGLLSNEDAAGANQLPFHSDFTYTECPIKVISLHAIELPRQGTTTSFASGVRAWSMLPQDRQELLAPMSVRHAHDSFVSRDLPAFCADQPVRFVHPRTSRPVLFVTEYHAKRILELEGDQSDRLLKELFAHLYAPEHVYVHQWAPYDLLIWDNLAVQHARTREASIGDGARVFQRVTINEVTYPELIARAQDRQRQRERPSGTE